DRALFLESTKYARSQTAPTTMGRMALETPGPSRAIAIKSMQDGNPTDPYRIFFPLGIILGAMGVAIWPLYYYGVTQGYSGRAHAFVQTDGFLYAFICGFLLTAIPRFTGTEPPSRRVQYLLAAIVACCAAAFEFQFFIVGQTMFVVAHFFLL